MHAAGGLCLLLAQTACQKGGGAHSPSGGDHPLQGVKAPDFSLPAQFGGDTVSLSSARGKVAIVDFWATWCEPCKESFPVYQGLLDQHAADLVVLGISEDDEPDGIPAFAAETGVKFPLGWDEDKSVAGNYKPGAMPTSYLIDRNGFVQTVHEAFRDGDAELLSQRVAELVAQ